MKIFFACVELLVLTVACFTVSAQNKRTIINGKVTSFEESLPLEGVSILVKGGKNTTGTQADGTFTLTISPEEKILLVSLEGYETKEIRITRASEYDIVLKRARSGMAVLLFNGATGIFKQAETARPATFYLLLTNQE